MKLSPDSPELTAYALGALSATERAEVEAALAVSPELRAEVAALAGTADELARAFAAEPALVLTPAQRAALVGQPSRLTRSEPAASFVDMAGAGEAASTAPSPARSPRSGSRRDRRDARPTLLELVRTWRQQLIWGAVGLCALVLTFVLLPRQRPATDGFGELRYQVRPVLAPAEPAAASAPASVGELGLSKSKLQVTDQAVDGTDRLAAGRTVAAAPPAQVQLSAAVPVQAPPPGNAPAGTGGTSAADARSKSLGDQNAGLELYRMDPVLARRYGLKPGNRPSPPTKLAETPLAQTDGLSTLPTARALGREDSQSGNKKPNSSASRMDPDPAHRYGVILEQKESAGREAYSRDLAAAAQQPAILQLRDEPAEPDVKLRYYYKEEARLPELLQREAEVLRRRGDSPGTESYGEITDNAFKDAFGAPLSTFGLDVDTASYANARRFLRDGSLPPRDAVRIEELINYFRYDYPQPRGGEPFATAVEVTDAPWQEGHKLVRVALQAKSVDRAERSRANLVFLLDVSGSMEPENKLPLVKRSLRLMLERLGDRDTVGIVTYAGESRVALEPTAVTAEGRRRITDVIEGLRAGSGTAGAAGIVSAYAMATNRFDREGVNRVILCTDGDFNLGITDPAELQRLIEEKARSGVFLSVLGFGLGNLKDSTMELLADKGNGNYGYVDSFSEARKLLAEQLDGTLVTVAKDVKVQVEFNPARVKSYRLLGYENRILRDRDFNDDTKDAGDVGAGHQVTVLYEIEPAGPNLAGTDPLRYQPKPELPESQVRLKSGHGDELLLLKLRYKQPDGDTSRLLETPVKDTDREFAQASADTRFAAAVAGYGMLLRQSPHKGDLTWEKVLRLAEQGLGPDKEGYRAEFVDLVRKAQQLAGGR